MQRMGEMRDTNVISQLQTLRAVVLAAKIGLLREMPGAARPLLFDDAQLFEDESPEHGSRYPRKYRYPDIESVGNTQRNLRPVRAIRSG
jgi:hypothetical protein